MYAVVEEIKKTLTSAIQADKSTDVSTQSQLVLVQCYIDKVYWVQKSFYSPLHTPNIETATTSISDLLKYILLAE